MLSFRACKTRGASLEYFFVKFISWIKFDKITVKLAQKTVLV